MLSNKAVIEEAIKDMVTVEHFKNGKGLYKSIISLPLMYPSGASVCIEIQDGDEETFLLSDYNGYDEAINSGVVEERYFKAAEVESDNSGISFVHGHFAAYAHKSKLKGAIITVANASLKAVDRAINTKG